MDKKVWAALGIVASIFMAGLFVSATFETTEDHDKDIEGLKETQKLELRAFAAEFAAEMGQKQAEIMLPSILNAIKKHNSEHSLAPGNGKPEILAYTTEP